MKPILLGLLALAVAFAGCTDNAENTRDTTNGGGSDRGSQVDGTIEVVEDTNSTTEGNGTTNETVTT